MNDVSPPRRTLSLLRVLGTVIACLAILGGAGAAIVIINRTEPTAQQIESTRKSAALVETVTVRRDTYRPRLVVLGTVDAAQDVTLSPRVSGQIIEVSPTFVPGGTVRAGDLLLRIDPADFENALHVSQSELEQAEASLRIEQGRQSLARKELALLEGTIDEINRALVLREPQVASIEAEVSAAKAAIERAQLDLERTSVTAPFDAQIIDCSVNVGSQVSPGDELARLVGIDEYWITATVPVRNLRWIQFPESDGVASAVTLRNPGIWPRGATRTAAVARMIGTLDRQTRLARVLITVADPLSRRTAGPPLILDTIVETHIECRPIENVVRLNRDYVREQDTVWVLKDDKLDIRNVDVDFRDAEHAYIRDGLEDGDEVVITTLATVAEGIGLKKMDSASETDNGGDPTDASDNAAEHDAVGSAAAADSAEMSADDSATTPAVNSASATASETPSGGAASDAGDESPDASTGNSADESAADDPEAEPPR